jgi:lysophospholipase L1-like esterase
MKSILAFGDSLTWGAVALKSLRHPHDVRWPNALAAGLKNVRVIMFGTNDIKFANRCRAFDAAMGIEQFCPND